MRAILGAVAAMLVATPAFAEVQSASDAGFAISHEVTVDALPADVYAMLRSPAKWWSKDHSWSGDAANFWMDAQAGGCFCEKLPGASRETSGSVEHARIVYAHPGKQLRMVGSLGPLQGEAATGTLTFALEAAGQGTKITLSYVVGGHVRMGHAAIAPAVDGVLGQQLASLAAQFQKAEPEAAAEPDSDTE